MINPQKIDLIRSKINIVDIIGQYLPLHKKGRNYWVVCPFHEDNNPSMSISSEKQIYRCFSCQASGNVFSFLQEYKNISFLEALKILATISNVEIDELNQYKKNKYDDKALKIFEINALAKEYFMTYLQTSDGIDAKSYLLKRNINDSLIERFSIGLSPKNNALFLYFQEKGYATHDLLLAGLITQQDDKFIDYFHNRIMFAIYDLDSNIVGFSSRVYQENRNPKYLNNVETKYFHKKNILYNLNQAQNYVKKTESIIICEGFMDVISLSKIDINNVVGLMGTNLTLEHQQLLKKFTNNIILFLDGDEAGIKATFKLIITLWKAQFNVQVIKIPENYDPDALVEKKEPTFIHSLIKNNCHPLDFIFSYFKSKVDLTKIQQVNSFIQQIKPFFIMLSDPIEINFYLNELQKITNLDIKFLNAKIFNNNELLKVESTSYKDKEEITSLKDIKINRQDFIFNSIEKAENTILLAIIKDKNILLNNDPFFLINNEKKELLEEINDWYEKNSHSSKLNIEQFINFLSKDKLKASFKKLINSFPLDTFIVTNEYINDCQEKIYKELVQKEIKELQKQQQELPESDWLKKIELGQKIVSLSQSILKKEKSGY